MLVITKSQAIFLSTKEGKTVLKEGKVNPLSYVPMVGFTLPEFGWHQKEKNMFFGKWKNPKVAYWIAYFMGEIQCLLNPTGKGIFHKVILLEGDEELPKVIHFSEMGCF